MKNYNPTPKHQLIQTLNDNEQQTILYDNLDNALIGIGQQHTKQPLAIYSHKHIIKTLQQQGMTYEEAHEYADYNILCAWVGDQTPIILNDLD